MAKKLTMWTGGSVPSSNYVWAREIGGENVLLEYDSENNVWLQSSEFTGTGPKGTNGTNGKSAYEYTVEGGFTGTEADFITKLGAL